MRLQWSKGGSQIIATASEVLDQAGDGAIENVQVIDAASEAIFFGDVDDPSYVFFKNVEAVPASDATQAEKDAANARVIHVGTQTPATSGNATFHLRPGQSAPIPDGGIVWYAIAEFAGSKLLVAAVDK